MSKFVIQVITFLLLCSQIGAQTVFESDFDFYKKHELSASQNDLLRIKRYNYIFVAGFLNEGIVGYFDENIELLKKYGVPVNQILVISASSARSHDVNAHRVYRKIQDFLKLSNRPIVLIGHSKGATEALLTAIQHPDMLKEKIEKIFAVQAAFGGSLIADELGNIAQKKPIKQNARVPLISKIRFDMIKKFGFIFTNYLNDGLMGLTTDMSQKFWRKTVQQLSEDTKDQLDQKLFFIQAYEMPEKQSSLLSPLGWYLNSYDKKNDGMLGLEDQLVDGVGQTLGVLEADHSDLTVSRPISEKSHVYRYALMKSILVQILR